MSELIHDQRKRMALLKHMILQLHSGEAPEAVRTQLVRLLGKIPYDEVVAVEQELIAEGLPTEEILRLCDVHTAALQGALHSGVQSPVPAGHPVQVMRDENKALGWEIMAAEKLFDQLAAATDDEAFAELLHDIRVRFNSLMDVEKHYLRKENLLFPFLEKHGITGPPTVMWGKHDETRALLAAAIAALEAAPGSRTQEGLTLVDRVLRPAVGAVSGMIDKEEQILLPMALETLAEAEWNVVAEGSDEIGYCLAAPDAVWRSAGGTTPDPARGSGDKIRLSTGSFTPTQLEAVLGTIPFDVTFVDADDTVRYFSHGRERIFARSRAILGRKVQYCHPPKSVDMVQRILDDFHNGRQRHAQFWIELGGKFICIEYFALRDPQGTYLGTLEVSQDLTAKRALQGQQRLLNYVGGEADGLSSAPPRQIGPADEPRPRTQAAPGSRPAWVDGVDILPEFDARELIAGGGHPLPEVLAALQRLQPGQGYALVSPFNPVPMIEKAANLGYRAWTQERGPGEFLTVFAPAAQG